MTITKLSIKDQPTQRDSLCPSTQPLTLPAVL